MEGNYPAVHGSYPSDIMYRTSIVEVETKYLDTREERIAKLDHHHLMCSPGQEQEVLLTS